MIKKLINQNYQNLELKKTIEIISKKKETAIEKLSILDYGCGEGRILKEINKTEYNLTGVEINQDYITALTNDGFTIYTPEKIFNGYLLFDIIIISHVIEHMDPNELYKIIPEICNLLKENGVIIIISPILGERFYYDFTHIKPYYPQSIRHIFGQKKSLMSKESLSLIELTDVYFFKDPYKTRKWRSYYFGSRPLRYFTFSINFVFSLLWFITKGLIGAHASWLGVYKIQKYDKK